VFVLCAGRSLIGLDVPQLAAKDLAARSLGESRIRVRKHDGKTCAEGENDGEANHAHHRVGTCIGAPGLIEGLLLVCLARCSSKGASLLRLCRRHDGPECEERKWREKKAWS